MITVNEILMGRDVEYSLSPEMGRNLNKLLTALNKFRTAYGKPMHVTSGYRPGRYNKAAGGALNSSHLTCEAADFSDLGGELKTFCLSNLKLLEDCGLFMEDPSRTPSWVHLQIRPTRNRVFLP